MKSNELESLRKECVNARMAVRTGVIALDEYKEIEQLYFDSLLLYVEKPFIS